jgi:NAD(P)-dependent dehydrogenase (short-subunit alcohol dehydrogenase family)
LLTGAGAGIGRATALQLAADGALVACVDIDARAAESTAVSICDAGGTGIAITADVTSEQAMADAVAQASDAFGGLDALVANAAVQLVGQDAPVHELDTSVWDATIAVNLTGVFLTCKYGIRELLAAGGGSVVCVTSGTAFYGLARGFDAYSASKGGIAALLRVMATDYAPYGIRVNGVVPGFTDTPMTAPFLTGDGRDTAADRIPIGRIGRPDEIAPIISFLLSDSASYVTGAIWTADGGQTTV